MSLQKEKDNFKEGSHSNFDKNWKNRPETYNNYWTSGKPKNQIELAFRMHWTLFKEILGDNSGKKVLEVGCGRGSISSYFAQNKFDCTLLDISSSVIEVAKKIFEETGHKANFVVGDALNLPFQDNEFDVIVSIGLFEHFENLDSLISEHQRVLKKGGRVLAYVVPENKKNIQAKYLLINKVLKFISSIFVKDGKKYMKDEIFRSNYNSDYYRNIIETYNVSEFQSIGMYPLPMISHSPNFPFSLLPKTLEKILTLIFESVLITRKIFYKKNPWTCEEELGQAFLITYKK